MTMDTRVEEEKLKIALVEPVNPLITHLSYTSHRNTALTEEIE